MATPPNRIAAGPRAASQQGFVYLPLIAGWLIPGAGHFLLRKWGRGALLAASILAMFIMGLAMQGKIYSSAHEILDILGLIGDLGNGLPYFVCRVFGLGADSGSGHHGRLGQPLHRGRRPAQHHLRRRRPQPPHREEASLMQLSHFSAVLLFAVCVSIVFGITMRDTPRAHGPLRALLLRHVRWIGDCAELGHVFIAR